MNGRYQLLLDHWNKLKTQKPLWFLWGGLACVFLLYYLIVILTLNYASTKAQDELTIDKKQIEWMAQAGQEIARLRQMVPHQRDKTSAGAFASVNQAINDQGWNNLVTDVRQVDNNRVQINFKSIAFRDLMAWLKKLYDKSGVYVLEASILKIRPGIVQATMVLQQDTSS